MARAAPLLLLAALVAASFPGLGFHAPPLPVLDEVPLAADGWAAWRFTMAAGGMVSWDVEGEAPGADLISVNLWILRPDPLRFDSAFTFYNTVNGGVVVHAQLPDPAGAVVSQRVPSGGVASGVGVTYEPNADSEFIAVAALASDGGLDGRLVLYGDASVQVSAKTTGPALLLREPDFAGAVSIIGQAAAPRPAQAPPNLVMPGAQVKVIEGAARTVDVAGALFGYFYGLSNTWELQLSMDAPGGARPLACQPNGQVCEATALLAGEPAGAWTFRIDHNVDTYDTSPLCRQLGCGVPVVYAVLADVDLPGM